MTALNANTDRRTVSNSWSSSTQRDSIGSNETGESSTATSRGNSQDVEPASGGNLEVPKTNRRSHKTRHSSGFLLGNTFAAGDSAAKRTSMPEPLGSKQDRKGKAALKSPEKKHVKRRSNVGAAPIDSSPLAANVTNVGGHDMGGDSTLDRPNEDLPPKDVAALDVDSARIVNLALNLSESRRNASRRNLSTPLPPLSQSFGDSLAGGSLRQHLQQQRRSSRNVSPKPDRGERAMTASPRIGSRQPIQSPLQAPFESSQDGEYQYHLSPSTLARAEKAKNAIELMAQYRRLLQYVPPLKPQPGTSEAGTAPSSPTTLAPPSLPPAPHPLGRAYNPLQYIRNRKVRARNAKAIDGEAQGFEDLEKVTAWVDEVSKGASSDDFRCADCLSMPSFSKAADVGPSPHTSLYNSIGKNQATALKIKRPRIDWVTNPADMIADVYWLEQDDNKKIIEDREGRLVFPKSAELRRPMSRRSDEPPPQLSPPPVHQVKKERSMDLRVDTKLPKFKSVKDEHDNHLDTATSKAKQKIRDVRDAARIHGQNGSVNDRRQFIRSLANSDTDSSDSDAPRRLRRRRSGTAASDDRSTDILAKQMEKILLKEAKELDSARTDESLESAQPLKNSPDIKKLRSPPHSRPGSVLHNATRPKRDSLSNGHVSSGRASLEVPGYQPRQSLEGLDSTAPNSPETKATRTDSFIPSIAMDLSSSRGRDRSPSKTPLERVKSKIRPFRGHSRERSRSRISREVTPTPGPPSASKEQTPERSKPSEARHRSTSPFKINSRRTDESQKPICNTGSLRRGKTEESGIRGLFKNRNPVIKVGDFLWKTKEQSLGAGTSSGFSTDESDVEDVKAVQVKKELRSRHSSTEIEEVELTLSLSGQEKPSFIDEMSSFTSPFEQRGRVIRTRAELDVEREAREERRKTSRARLLEPTPRIDIHNASPSSSPDGGLSKRYTRESSASDSSRRDNFVPGVQGADARLNAILGLPGKRRDAMFVTGLSHLETTQDSQLLGREREWSISGRGVSLHRGPMTKQEIARVRALLLSSGIKAAEISRRAAEMKDFGAKDEPLYAEVVALSTDPIPLVPKGQGHLLAAKILSNDIQLSSRVWQSSADTFVNSTISALLRDLDSLKSKLSDNLTPTARRAGDEADEVGKDLVTEQTLQVKRVTDKIDKMTRRRRRRFRWLRRGGWVMVEWALVGVMWYVWFMVVLARVVLGIGKGAVAAVRWLLFF